VVRLFCDEHAALYPEGHNPGEKYAVEPMVHPEGKQRALFVGPRTVWYSDGFSLLINQVERQEEAGEKTVVSAGGSDIFINSQGRRQKRLPNPFTRL